MMTLLTTGHLGMPRRKVAYLMEVYLEWILFSWNKSSTGQLEVFLILRVLLMKLKVRMMEMSIQEEIAQKDPSCCR